MATVYKVGKKWRADFTDKQGVRHRERFRTQAQAEDFLTEKKAEIKDDTYVAPRNIPTFGALAAAWCTGRNELSRTRGAGYRPTTLAQAQRHIAHTKAG